MIRVKYTIAAVLLAMVFLIAGCSQGKKQENASEHDKSEMSHDEGQNMAEEQADHEHASGEEGHHHEGGSMEMSGNKSMNWKPGSGNDYTLTEDFHFIIGGLENISPQVIQNDLGDNHLQLTANGSPTAFVFHQTYGNVGMAAMINIEGFDGTFKLIHHAKNADNHEFVSINGGKMKLGRMVNGNEEVFDEGSFDPVNEWINLRVSAAGTHFKGYMGNETVTHGHGDKMQDGYVGIMLEGIGNVLIKSIEIVPLEDE
ncbi:MAG: hypothetical protein RLO17_19600 [Cyclobacteriaceae bacterium]